MSTTYLSDALIDAFEEGLEKIARKYPGSGTKTKLRLARKALALSQKEFAAEFGISVATVRNWEQPNLGEPSGAAKALIDLIAEDPITVLSIQRKSRLRQENKTKIKELENAD